MPNTTDLLCVQQLRRNCKIYHDEELLNSRKPLLECLSRDWQTSFLDYLNLAGKAGFIKFKPLYKLKLLRRGAESKSVFNQMFTQEQFQRWAIFLSSTASLLKYDNWDPVWGEQLSSFTWNPIRAFGQPTHLFKVLTDFEEHPCHTHNFN